MKTFHKDIVVVSKINSYSPVTALPLDERRGVPTRSFFDLPTEGVLFVRRREATRKATKPIAKGRAVTQKLTVTPRTKGAC